MVDSGTTTTRLRLWSGDEQVWTGSRSAGARDTAIDGNTGKVRAALRELLEEAGDARLDAIVCSGMITSNMGLLEVPHLQAPASPDDIAGSIVQKHFPDVAPVPLSFIPGVKTPPVSGDLHRLGAGDLLRGEEAEIVGLWKGLPVDRAAVFLHIGSHHKAIHVDAEGRIVASRTAVTGELLNAVTQHTILKSSVTDLDQLDVDHDAALAGAEATKEFGFGRALFLVRVGEQLANRSRETMTNYLLGALAALDLPLLDDDSHAGMDSTACIIYGGTPFQNLLSMLLTRLGWKDVRSVGPRDAEMAAAHGALWLFQRGRDLGAVR